MVLKLRPLPKGPSVGQFGRGGPGNLKNRQAHMTPKVEFGGFWASSGSSFRGFRILTPFPDQHLHEHKRDAAEGGQAGSQLANLWDGDDGFLPPW